LLKPSKGTPFLPARIKNRHREKRCSYFRANARVEKGGNPGEGGGSPLESVGLTVLEVFVEIRKW